MRPTVIALVAPSIEILGGQAIQAQALAQGLWSEGYEVLWVPINPTFPRLFRKLRRYSYVRTVLNQALYLPALSGLRRADIVHIFSASYWSFVLASVPAIVAARSLGKRVVLHYHSGEAFDHLARWGPLVHPWLHLTDEIVVPSEYLRRVFGGYGYRTHVIRNTLDTSRFMYRERRPLRPSLLSTRNFEPHYRVNDVLEAFARLKARHSDATLTLAGNGSEERRLRNLAGSLCVDGIHFTGRVEPEDMPAVYDRADIFVNSSVIDNQPVSVLEAFAAGLPVVSTATGDIAAMVRDGETGRVVPSGSPGAMADAVADLLAHPDDARRLAWRGRQSVEGYTWPQVREAWATIYSRNGGATGPC